MNMGEQRLFEDLLAEYERPILRLCYRLLGNMADAQDAAQEVFLKAHRNLDRYDRGRSASPWLYQIAVNTCRDQFRRQRPALEIVPGRVITPEEEAQAGQQREILQRALRELPPKEREALVLRELEGLATAEVAVLLGSTEETVRSQVSHAKAKLKVFVERYTARRMS